MGRPASLHVSRLEIAGTLSETKRLHAWLDGLLEGGTIPEATGQALRLCVEEAVMNVILHGYGAEQPGAIEIALWPEAPGILVEVRDRAPPFDPTGQQPRPPPADLQSGPLGGNGVVLMRRYSDFLRYEYRQGQNRLTMGFTV